MFAFVVVLIFILFFLAMVFLKDPKSLKVAAGLFLGLLLGGLSIAGAMAIATGVFEYVTGRSDLGQLFVQVGAGALFAFAGGAFFHLYFIKARLLKRRLEKRRVRYPDMPWNWDERWADSHLVYHSGSPVLFVWFVLSGLTLGFAFVAYMNRETIISRLRAGDLETMLFFGLLCAILLPCLIAAVRLLRARRAFGDSIFEMRSLPAPVGGELRGRIHTSLRELVDGPVETELRCRMVDLRPKPRHGTASRHRATIIWDAVQEIAPERLTMGAKGISIPVSFAIPADAKESDAWSTDWQISWTLTAAATVAGKPYFSSFEIPVFKVG